MTRNSDVLSQTSIITIASPLDHHLPAHVEGMNEAEGEEGAEEPAHFDDIPPPKLSEKQQQQQQQQQLTKNGMMTRSGSSSTIGPPRTSLNQHRQSHHQHQHRQSSPSFSSRASEVLTRCSEHVLPIETFQEFDDDELVSFIVSTVSTFDVDAAAAADDDLQQRSTDVEMTAQHVVDYTANNSNNV